MIRPATPDDAHDILKIYSPYVLESHATFELEPPSVEFMTGKIKKAQHPWLVLEENQQIVGYAYATQWKPRQAYNQTAETSVYIQKECHGKGYGHKLYVALIAQLSSQKYHALLAGISLPNDPSIRLHEKLGFEKVG